MCLSLQSALLRHQPRVKGVFHELQREILDVAECGVVKVADHMQRQLCDRFGQHPHAGINGNLLHCRAVVDTLSGSASAEEVGVAGAVVAVPRFVSAFEKSFENAHGNHAPFG